LSKRISIITLVLIVILSGCNSKTEKIETKNPQAKNTKVVSAEAATPKEILACGKDDPQDQQNKLPQDAGQDPFSHMAREGTINFGAEVFQYRFVEDIAFQQTAQTLISVSETFNLFHNYGGVLTLYNNETKQKQVIDNNINQAILTPDEEFVIYTKNAIFNETFYYMDTKVGEKKEFFTFENKERMKVSKLAYKDGMIYFSYNEDGSNETVVKTAAIPAYASDFSEAEKNLTVSQASDKLLSGKDNILYFNPVKSTIETVSTSVASHPMAQIQSEKVQELLNFDAINDGQFTITLKNENDERVILTTGKKIKCYEAAMKTLYLDEDYLLVNDNLSLYLYDVKKNESSLIKSDIVDFHVASNRVVIETNDGEYLELSKADGNEDKDDQKKESAETGQTNTTENSEKTESPSEETTNKIKSATSITLDNIPDYSSQGNIYHVQKKGSSQVTLEHPTWEYQIDMDARDFETFILEETEQDGISSTGFYYLGADIKAFVFSIDNYALFAWDEYEDYGYEVLGRSDVRVMSYTAASENPFPPGSKESDEYLKFVEKVSEYIKTFRAVKPKQ
jgi:hypothetical protein